MRRIVAVAVALFALSAWPRLARSALTPVPATVPFGNVLVGSTSMQTLQLNNNSLMLTVGSITPSATCITPDFVQISPTTPFNVPTGSSVTLTMSFTPQNRGSESCTFDVRNVSGVILCSFTVTGTGVAPVSVVTPPNGPPVAFGSVPVGGSTSLQIQVANTTTDTGQNLHFPTAISTSNAADFTITSSPNPPADVAPSTATNVTVTFHPSATGVRNATITFTTNDAVNSPQTVSVTGTGTSNQAISISPSPFDYGIVIAGTTTNRNFAISNTGTAGNLIVTSAQIIGGGGWLVFTNTPAGAPNCSGQTSCTYSPALSIAPAGSQSVQVACSPPPDVIGTQNATLSVSSNAISGINMVNLSCTAGKPDITIMPNAPQSHDFGNVTVGSNATFNGLVVGNAGGTTLHYTITRPNTGSSPDFVLTGVGCSGGNTCTNSIVAGGPSVTYSVAFTPSAQGSRGTTLTITSDDQDPGDNSQTFGLTGVGTQAFLSAVPANNGTLSFNSVPVGTEFVPFQAVTITNTGNLDMSITSAVLGGTNPGDFEIKAGSSGAQTVTAGSMTSWSLTCKPTSRGAKSATFTVTNNSTNLPSYKVNLTCTGTGPNVVASVPSIAFGNVREGMTAMQTFTLTNNGETTATFGASTLLPNNVGYTFSGVPATLSATPGSNTATVTVTFAPTAGVDGGPATLTMPSDAANSPAIVTITGTGQPFGISITCPDCAGAPPTMDFGDVRWDQTRPEVFTIANTADSSVQITGIALTEIADFQLSGLPGNFPITLNKGGSITVTVTAAPNDTMLGTFTSKLQVQTDLPSPMMLIERALTVNSVSPALSVQPGTPVDFGGVDIDAGTAKTLTITVQNTGDGPMDITSWPALSGGVFTSAAVSPKSIPAGMSQTLDVSYLPTTEKTAGAGDTVDMIVTIDGLFSSGNPQPTAQKITLKGHGIDRHIQLLNSPVTFPASFDNPTDAESPPLSCDVQNTGEAPLIVNGLMLDASSSPAFMLLDPAQTIAGGATAHFRVAFKPTAPGTNYDATLVLMHDDEDIATPHVSDCMLTGTAVSRIATVMPTSIDLGTTYVGVPVSSSEHGGSITVHNGSTIAFTVREVRITDGGTEFEVATAAGQTVAPGSDASYDVTFTPDAAGDFHGTVQVFLDNQTDPAGSVTLSGHGIARRGSYYSCSSTSSAGALPAGFVILFVVMRRRRRR